MGAWPAHETGFPTVRRTTEVVCVCARFLWCLVSTHMWSGNRPPVPPPRSSCRQQILLVVPPCLAFPPAAAAAFDKQQVADTERTRRTRAPLCTRLGLEAAVRMGLMTARDTHAHVLEPQ